MGKYKRAGRPRQELPDVDEPNDFARWLRDMKMTPEQAAALFDVHVSTVYGWRRGSRPPSWPTRFHIEKVTKGKVAATSWEDAA